MISKYQFLFDNKVLVKNEGILFLKEHPDIEMSKKQLNRLISLLFDYLSRCDVYVNVHDPDFSNLIFKDLIFLILNPRYSVDDPEFLDTFKKSNRHVHSKIRDKLMEFHEFLELEKYRSILDIINEDSPLGGRPSIDNILKLEILFLKVYFDESYGGIIEKIKTDDACQCFLSYPSKIIGRTTLWDFHQKITNKLLIDEMWGYHKILLNNRGYHEGKSIIQDATFYVADKGHKKASYPRGDQAETRRNSDGTFSIKKW
jgi:hypothetical protein